MTEDNLRRFILDTINVRGEWVHLDSSWQQLLACADYPPKIRDLLGEALTAIVLLSATIKHKGSLILQIRGDGPVHLLVVQATPQGTVRGLARWNNEYEHADANESEGNTLSEIFGNGHMAITLEAENDGERYQGIIGLEGDNLTQALEQYFQQSEQLPTRLWLTADANSCAGLLLQRLPAASNLSVEQAAQQTEDWQRISMLLDTLTATELQELAAEELVYRLFHEDSPAIYPSQPIRFHCGCSQQKVESMLQSLGQEEADSILEEQNQIEITCEFCNASYTLDRVDVAKLFVASVVEPPIQTLH